MRPSVIEVANLLRNSDHYLMDKLVKDWSEKDYLTWHCLKAGIEFAKPARPKHGRKAIKIIRLLDGHIYNTFTECYIAEHMSGNTLKEKLKLEIEFKRL